MHQWTLILQRLKTPSVITSIASQIAAVILLFDPVSDRSIVITVITSICSILVVLGIISNPDTQNKGYGDDFLECAGCHQITQHVRVGDSMVCIGCGCINESWLPAPRPDGTINPEPLDLAGL